LNELDTPEALVEAKKAVDAGSKVWAMAYDLKVDAMPRHKSV